MYSLIMMPLVRKFGRFLLLPLNNEKEAMSSWPVDTSNVKEIKQLSSFLKKISSKFLLLIADEKKINCDEISLRRLLKVAGKKHAGIVYSDYFVSEGNNLTEHPLIDYQQGSIRDDFNFGHLLLFSCDAVKSVLQKYGSLPSDASEALYDLRLKISTDYELIHVPQFLYKVSAKEQKKNKISGEKTEAHFAYVAKEDFTLQKKLEKIATNHLKRIGACLPPQNKKTNKEQNERQWKASIIIPVLNRKKTIADALDSALEQKTDFAFNVIVVDNHSTDGTTEILKKYAAKYSHVHHIIPARRDLGIGGCWNEAIYSPHCGRYVVQLDSDDLYSSPQALQKIVNALRKGNYAMVVGSYTVVNENLKKIPPGLIDHREWTQKNGHNNLLRVNGMGAPRAFDFSVIRKFGFPNVSYGEDYAVALRITREYKIGRIYENLYWCRRWTHNTDAGLSPESKNRNDFYKDKLRTVEIEARKPANKEKSSFDEERIFAEFSNRKDVSLPLLCQSLYDEQKKTWPQLTEACANLSYIKTRQLSGGAPPAGAGGSFPKRDIPRLAESIQPPAGAGGFLQRGKNYNVYLQYNPARAVSSGAAVDAESIKSRPCFLCQENLPREQKGILYKNQYLLLCNPAPIFKNHFTIVSLRHEPQEIASSLTSLLELASDASPEYAVFYNGPACGASAPDHLHFQAIPKNHLPFLRDYKKLLPVEKNYSVRCGRWEILDRSVILLESKNAEFLTERFLRLIKLSGEIYKTNYEPMVNVICDYSSNRWRLIVFLRQKHRPDDYFARGENRIFISPGAVDMAGMVITPLLNNYNRLDYNAIRKIYREVSLPENMMSSIINKF